MIALHELQVGYGDTPIFPSLTGTFEAGSLTAIMGDNGIGKTTLLKTLTQTIAPLTGQVIIGEQAQKSIAWLPQHSEIERHFPITVFDTVAMGAVSHTSLFRSLSKYDYQRIHDAMARVGIAELAHRSIDRLSGGQFQRMLFARMLVQDAEILLMDEPFVGIDTVTQSQLLFLIKGLHRTGKTIIAVLHDANIVHQHFPSLLHISKQAVYWGETAKSDSHQRYCRDISTPCSLHESKESTL